MITMHINANWEKGKSAVNVKAGKHQMFVDEAAKGGGEDLGPNPVEVLLSAMSGCFVVVGKMIAKEMGLDIRGVKITAEGDLDPAGFMGKDPSVPVQVQQIRLKVEVDSPADRKEIEKWLATTEKRCPVVNTVGKGTKVTAALK